jgi:hypothetical protein
MTHTWFVNQLKNSIRSWQKVSFIANLQENCVQPLLSNKISPCGGNTKRTSFKTFYKIQSYNTGTPNTSALNIFMQAFRCLKGELICALLNRSPPRSTKSREKKKKTRHIRRQARVFVESVHSGTRLRGK